MENERNHKVLFFILPVIIALISVFVFARLAASPSIYTKLLNSLDRKRNTVLELTAASTTASAAITLLPGDTATPIAEKLADLSGYFLIVLCAIYLEKYLLPIAGGVSFGILIPVACLLEILFVLKKGRGFQRQAVRILLFGFAFYLLIPASVGVSDMIEKTYQASINETIELAVQTSKTIEEEDETGLFDRLTEITDAVSDIPAKLRNVLNDFLEALAVMIITSCVIPILVMVFFVWFIRILMGGEQLPFYLPPRNRHDHEGK